MKNSGLFCFALLTFGLLSPALHAQGDDRKALIRVEMEGMTSGVNYEVFTSTDTSPSTEWLVAHPSTPGGFDTTASNEAFSKVIHIKPGVVHTVGIQQGTSTTPDPLDYGSFEMTIKAPAGFTVFIDSDGDYIPDRPVSQLSGTKTFAAGGISSFAFQVVDNRALSASVAGQLTRLDVADLVIELGLGSLKNGKSAGRLQLRHDGRNGGSYGLPSAVFTPGLLNFVGPSPTNLNWASISGGQKLETGQVKVEKIAVTSDKYTVSFYAGDDSGGYAGSAFATYTLEKITSGLPSNAPSSSDCLKITEVQGSLTLVRYVFRSTAGDTWTLIEGTGGEQRIQEHASAPISGNREETVTIKNSTSATVAKSRQTWAPYGATELLVKSEVWTDASSSSPEFTTEYEYYTGGGVGAGERGQLKEKTTYPNGATTEYEYYNDSARLGRVSKVTEPWSTGSSTSSKVTTYDYTGPGGGSATLKEYVSEEETKIGGTTVAKTSHSYDFSQTSADSLALVVRTSTHYSAAAASVTSVTTSYNKNVAYFHSGRPYAIKYPDGRQQSFRYQTGTYSGGSFTAGTGNASRTYIVEGSHLGGSATTSIASLTFASIGLVTKQSTLTEVIRDAEDNVISEKTSVWDGSAFDTGTPIVNTTHSWLDGVRQSGQTAVNGAVQDWTWNGAYLASQKDPAGVELTYGYDSVGRVSTVTRTSLSAVDGYQTYDAVTTTYGYDAAGRKTAETESSGSLSRTTTYSYDAAGRPTGAVLPDGRTMSSSYSFTGGLSRTVETLACGGTITTDTLIDGKTKEVTGSVSAGQYYSYSVDGNGRITTQINYASSSSSRWRTAIIDWLGRTVESSQPALTGLGNFTESRYYDAYGRLNRISRTDLADELFGHDVMGRVTRAGVDLSGNGSLNPGSDAADRVTDYETVFDKVSSQWWVRATQTVHPTTVSSLVTGRSWLKLTGLGSGTLTESGQEDTFGNRVTTVTTVDRTKKRVTATMTYPGVSNTAVSVSNNGFPVKMTGTDGRHVTQVYDGVGRLYQQADSRTGTTTYTYLTHSGNATNQLSTVTDPTSAVVATYTYDAGRIASIKNAGNHYIYQTYDCTGRLTRRWGGAVTPVEYVYNDYSQIIEQRTFRSGTWTGTGWPGGTADTTTFTYDGPSGLLTQKADAAGNRITYTYNARGLVATREWERLNSSFQRVKTTYGYATNSTELTSKTYNDGTPDVSYTYGRLGQMLTAVDVSDGSTVQTRTFEYDTDLRLTTEKLPAYLGSRWISYTYEDGTSGTVDGRASGYTLGVSGDLDSDLTSLLAYSGTTGNVASLTATHNGVSARTFSYSYVGNSSLVSGVSQSGIGYTQTRAYETNRDLLTEFTTKFSTTTKTRYDYTYNNLGQRESAKQYGQSGSAFADMGNDTFYRYAYNSRGELTEATGYLGTNVSTLTAPLPGRNFQFGFDEAGNRSRANSTGVSGLQADYTPNNLNRIASRENHYVPVSGTVDSAAKVVVNGELAGQQGNYWSGEAVLNNTSGPAHSTSIAVKAAKTGPETKKIAGLLTAFIAPAVESFSYDADGNLTDDGQWDYTWDAENRLVKMETDSVAMAAGLPGKRLVFRYDSLGRRTAKETWTYSGSWSKTAEVRFVYQGWNLVAELDTSGNRQRTHAWGLDLSGSLGAMGGIGALVQTVNHTGTVTAYLPGYDGSGNVAAIMKDNGDIVAAYEYGPFGEPLRKEGAYAATNSFRSATKYTDEESGLVYYGHRYYSPSLGRFINKDPIGEAGGLNLYAFAGNDPVNRWDSLGLSSITINPETGTIFCWEETEKGGNWSACGSVHDGWDHTGGHYYVPGSPSGPAGPTQSTEQPKNPKESPASDEDYNRRREHARNELEKNCLTLLQNYQAAKKRADGASNQYKSDAGAYHVAKNTLTSADAGSTNIPESISNEFNLAAAPNLGIPLTKTTYYSSAFSIYSNEFSLSNLSTYYSSYDFSIYSRTVASAVRQNYYNIVTNAVIDKLQIPKLTPLGIFLMAIDTAEVIKNIDEANNTILSPYLNNANSSLNSFTSSLLEMARNKALADNLNCASVGITF